MSFWSGDKLVANKEIITDFNESNIEANSYSLHMGEYYFRTHNENDDGPQAVKSVNDGESFIIPAGQFAYLVTKESVSIPNNAMAFISVRATIKLQGLIDISGFHIDPGYSGKLVFAVFNSSPSPIHLFGGESLFKIWIADLDASASDKYVFEGKPHNKINNGMTRGLTTEIHSLPSVLKKVESLEKDIMQKLAEQKTTTDNLNFIWRTIVVSVIVATIISVMSVAGVFRENHMPAIQKEKAQEETRASTLINGKNLINSLNNTGEIENNDPKSQNIDIESSIPKIEIEGETEWK